MTRYNNEDDDDDDPSPQGRIPSERWISSTTTSVEGGFIRTSSGRLVPTRGSSKSILDDPAGSDTLSTGPLEGEQLMDTSRGSSRGSRLWNRLCEGNCLTNVAFVLAVSCFIAGATAILWVFTYNQSSDGFVNQHSFRRHKDVEEKDESPHSPPLPTTVFTLPAPPYDLQEKCSPDHFLQTAEGLAICDMICGPATSCCILSEKNEKVSETSTSSSSNYYKYDDDYNNNSNNDDDDDDDNAGDDNAYYYNDQQQQEEEEEEEEEMAQEEEPMVPSYYNNNNNKMEDDDDDDYVQDDFYNNGRRRRRRILQEESCYDLNKETCELYYEGCQHIYINGETFGPP